LSASFDGWLQVASSRRDEQDLTASSGRGELCRAVINALPTAEEDFAVSSRRGELCRAVISALWTAEADLTVIVGAIGFVGAWAWLKVARHHHEQLRGIFALYAQTKCRRSKTGLLRERVAEPGSGRRRLRRLRPGRNVKGTLLSREGYAPVSFRRT
jgi:hypothetical protein